MMRVIGRTEVDALVDMPAMIEAMRGAFRDPVVEPVRHHHVIERPNGADKTLLLMPAWTDGASTGPGPGYAGVKIVTVSPDNHRHGKPSILGTYILTSGETGEPLAAIDGQALTLWRTAAASGLAASYLAPRDARRHLVVGAGALSPFLALAMRAVRPIEDVLVWNRSPDKAALVASELRALGVPAEPAADLRAAVEAAHIVSAATLSRTALVEGAWLRPGTHLDLVGAFSPAMRETDDAAVSRSRVFVDTRAGALKEGGDLVQAIAAGAFAAEDVVAELSDLARGTSEGRLSDEELTLFKSVGAAREDLAAAVLVYERALARNPDPRLPTPSLASGLQK